MSSPSFSSTLYDCATECALRRQNKRCRETFGSEECNYCKLNINRYIDADPRHVDLYMMQANTRARELRSSWAPAWAVLITAALIIGWIWLGNYKAKQSQNAYIEKRRLEMQYEQPRSTARTAPTTASSGYRHIEPTLRRVSQDMRRKADVNRDGLTNCIDAAVLFYQYFPDKNLVCIMLNQNPATGMNHLFNVVMVDGNWRAVEPQAYFSGHSSWWMRDVWGRVYDSSINRDVTAHYARYVK